MKDRLVHVVNKGYITLFPLLLGILPIDSPKVGHLLDIIYDPNELWSPFGICSLSKSNNDFGTKENYWRGPIWMPINYLLLQSLHNNYMAHLGPYKEKATKIYNELRQNLVKNVFKEYQRTGFAWEQYGCMDGIGARSHPFTGWTSLILMIMSEKY